MSILPIRPIAIILDFITILLSFYFSYWLRLVALKVIPFGSETELNYYYGLILSILVIWLWLFTLLGGYERPLLVSMRTEIRVVCKVVFLGSLILLTVIFFFKVYMTFLPRSLMFIFVLLNPCLLILEKLALYSWVNGMRKKGQKLLSTVVAGDINKAAEFAKKLIEHPELGLDPIGIFSNSDKMEGILPADIEILGDFNDLGAYLHKNHVDEVILTVDSKMDIENLLKACKEEGVKTRLISDIFGNLQSNITVEMLGDIASITLFKADEKEWQYLIKRVMDICFSSLLLILLFPLLLLIAVLIKLTSPGPVLYEWKVLGFNKKPFKSWKFRTMVVDADSRKEELMSENEMSGPMFKMKDDPRITSQGKFLRKFSLDELPQILSVLKGDMSMVGPRPPLVSELDRFEQWHGRKLRIRPGITCLWQVSGRNVINNFDDWVKLDLEYIENWSLLLDLKILLKTIPVVLRGTGR